MRRDVIKIFSLFLLWVPSALKAAEKDVAVNTTQEKQNIAPVETSPNLKKDLRHEALREAALSWGMRRGLVEQSREIEDFVRKQGEILAKIYNFKSLLLELSSGVFLQPPVIIEADEGISLEENGRVATLAHKTYRIIDNARLVISARGWEEYLTLPLDAVDPPPRVLFPRTSEEEEAWQLFLAEGQEQGRQQGREIFEENLARLECDFNGQVLYCLLLRQHLVNPPYVAEKSRGITGDNVVLRIGDQEVRVTADAAFQQRKEKWQPQIY